MLKKTTKTIVLIFAFLILYTTVSFSQNNPKNSIFAKIQWVPSVGVNYKLTDYAVFRHSFLITGSGLIGNAALLFSIYDSKNFTCYLGSSYSVDMSESLDFRSMGILIGAELPLKNNFELFGELGVDVSTGENNDRILFAMTGVGIKYSFGK